MKRIHIFVLALVLTIQICPVMAEVIDDFEDGVINTDLWCIAQGNWGGEGGWGEVYETGGQLVLTSFDPDQYGGGVADAVLKVNYFDVRIQFSFELTMYDDTLDGGQYTPVNTFMITGKNTIDNWSQLWETYEVVYNIRHDQQNNTNQFSGTYYYYFDSALKEARLYDASNDALLGSASYADFASGPYIWLTAYSDTYDGYVEETLTINEISVVPEPATLFLLTLGGLVLRRRK
jgi:hypothetical protein